MRDSPTAATLSRCEGQDRAPTPPPATYTWTVDTEAPRPTIDTHPDDPSPGRQLDLHLPRQESGSTFQCSSPRTAAPDSFSSCSSGKTYSGLANGTYTFKVRATDPAGNQGAAATFTWTVDNGAPDTTPRRRRSTPNPPIRATKPGRYLHLRIERARPPRMQTRCSLRSRPALPTGINLQRARQRRPHLPGSADDASDNTDQTPAGYSFTVAVLATTHPGPGKRTTLLVRPTTAFRLPVPDTTITAKPPAKAARPHPTLPLQIDARRFHLPVQGRRQGLQDVPLAVHNEVALVRQAHGQSPRAVAGGIADPSPAQAQLQGRQALSERRESPADPGADRLLALVGLPLWAPTASATFHLMEIREVYPGLRRSGRRVRRAADVCGRSESRRRTHPPHLRLRPAPCPDRNAVLPRATFPRGPTRATILMATPEAEAQFGVAADGSLSPPGQLDPTGGAVCWESLDCVSWGNSSGRRLPRPALPATPADSRRDGAAADDRPGIARPCSRRATIATTAASTFPPVFPNPAPELGGADGAPCAASRGRCAVPAAVANPGAGRRRRASSGA